MDESSIGKAMMYGLAVVVGIAGTVGVALGYLIRWLTSR